MHTVVVFIQYQPKDVKLDEDDPVEDKFVIEGENGIPESVSLGLDLSSESPVVAAGIPAARSLPITVHEHLHPAHPQVTLVQAAAQLSANGGTTAATSTSTSLMSSSTWPPNVSSTSSGAVESKMDAPSLLSSSPSQLAVAVSASTSRPTAVPASATSGAVERVVSTAGTADTASAAAVAMGSAPPMTPTGVPTAVSDDSHSQALQVSTGHAFVGKRRLSVSVPGELMQPSPLPTALRHRIEDVLSACEPHSGSTTQMTPTLVVPHGETALSRRPSDSQGHSAAAPLRLTVSTDADAAAVAATAPATTTAGSIAATTSTGDASGLSIADTITVPVATLEPTDACAEPNSGNSGRGSSSCDSPKGANQLVSSSAGVASKLMPPVVMTTTTTDDTCSTEMHEEHDTNESHLHETVHLLDSSSLPDDEYVDLPYSVPALCSHARSGTCLTQRLTHA
jgi:hypothetical protein